MANFLEPEKLYEGALEPNFLREVSSRANSLKKNGAKISIETKKETEDNFFSWSEINLVQGVKVERGYNGAREFAILDKSQAWRGLLNYTYDLNRAFEQNRIMNYAELELDMILRCYVVLESSIRVKVTLGDGKAFTSPEKVVVVAENQLYRPPSGARFEEEGDELLKLYSLGKWYVCDVDGIYKGNSFFPGLNDEKKNFVYERTSQFLL